MLYKVVFHVPLVALHPIISSGEELLPVMTKRECVMVLASRLGVWVPFWTCKPLKRTPKDTQIFKCGISKNLNLKLRIEFFHLLIISMTLFNDNMPYFDELIHVYD